jgi:hypothetical protein
MIKLKKYKKLHIISLTMCDGVNNKALHSKKTHAL